MESVSLQEAHLIWRTFISTTEILANVGKDEIHIYLHIKSVLNEMEISSHGNFTPILISELINPACHFLWQLPPTVLESLGFPCFSFPSLFPTLFQSSALSKQMKDHVKWMQWCDHPVVFTLPFPFTYPGQFHLWELPFPHT